MPPLTGIGSKLLTGSFSSGPSLNITYLGNVVQGYTSNPAPKKNNIYLGNIQVYKDIDNDYLSIIANSSVSSQYNHWLWLKAPDGSYSGFNRTINYGSSGFPGSYSAYNYLLSGTNNVLNILRGFPNLNQIDRVYSNGNNRIFNRSGSNTFAPLDAGSGDLFGSKVFATGNKIIVRSDGFNSYAGKIYIFDDEGYNEIQVIPSTNTTLLSLYDGGIHSDDSKIVVGYAGQNSEKGKVYIYDIDGTNEIIIDNPDTTNRYFGNEVKVSSSENIVVISCIYDDTNKGAVYIYDTSGNFVKKITCPDINGSVTSQVEFGAAIDIVDNDKIVVGAPKYNADGSFSEGRSYIFDKTGVLLTIIENPDQEYTEYDGFGSSISSVGKQLFINANDARVEYGGTTYNDMGEIYEYLLP